MSWKLPVTSAAQRIIVPNEFEVNIGTAEYSIKFGGDFDSASSINCLNGADFQNFRNGLYYTNLGAFRIYSSGQQRIGTPNGAMTLRELSQFEFRHHANGDWEFLQDGVITATGVYTENRIVRFKDFGRWGDGSNDESFIGDFYYFETTGFSSDNRWDAALSGPTGDLLRTASGTNEGTLVGFDPDPWVAADPLDPPGDELIVSLWPGHVTSNGLTASCKVSGSPDVKFIVSETDDFAVISGETPMLTPDGFGIVRGTITGLTPSTSYFLGVSDGTEIATLTGKFRTPASSAHNFKFGSASCANTGSDELIFDTIRADDLDFFIQTGDIHYADIGTNNVALFHTAMDQVFGADRQRDLWASLPMYYMWDDHDYGPNDSHKDSPQRPAAVEFYRGRVPSPTLALSGPSGAIYYSFVRGRVRFVVSDLRSERFEKGTFPSDDPQQLMMSAGQLTWIKNQLDSAALAGQSVCWVSSVPWIEATTDGSDAWGGYNAQRQEIADFINERSYNNRVFILSGDMHSLAFDDGTSVNNFADLKVIQSAPLDRGSSSKGGPYLVGPIGASGTISQYSTIKVTDAEGPTITVTVDGFSVDRATGDKTLEYTQSFNLTAESIAPNIIPLTAAGIPDGTYSVDLLPVGGGIEDWFRETDVVFTGGSAQIETLLAVDDELVGIVYTDVDLPATGAGLYAVVTNGS